ncbi:MAG TPA: hypothetical protein VIL14_00725 [Nitrososphaeraceae archaeon]
MNLNTMNKLFIFSMALMLSLALGYGVAIPQSALAALGQGYDSNSYSNSYDNSYSKYPQKSMSYDNSYSKYPQKSMSYDNNYKKEFKPYECRKGSLEGFFTSSVEFCIKATR